MLFFIPRIFEAPCKGLGRIMVFCLGLQNVKVVGERATSQDAPILCVAPHSSFYDGVTVFFCSGFPSAISKAENGKLFLISGT